MGDARRGGRAEQRQDDERRRRGDERGGPAADDRAGGGRGARPRARAALADRRDRLDPRRREAAPMGAIVVAGSSSLWSRLACLQRSRPIDASMARGADECYVFALAGNWY